MSLFEGMERKDDIAAPKDTLGGSFIVDSGVYDATVKLVYAGVSKKGAKFLSMEFELDNGQTYTENVYFTSAKGSNTYTDAKGVEHYLPGFVTCDELVSVITKMPLSEQETEDKTVELYDFEDKIKKPTVVPVLTDLLGQKCKLAIRRALENKNVLGDDGKYVPTDEIVERNYINKVFNEDGYSYNELVAKADQPKFIHDWDAKYKDTVHDKTVKNAKAAPKQTTKKKVEGLF